MQRRLGVYVCGRELLPASHQCHLSVRGYDDDDDEDEDEDEDDGDDIYIYRMRVTGLSH